MARAHVRGVPLIERSRGAIKLPRNIFRFVLEKSGLHQLLLVLLTVGVFLLEDLGEREH